MRKTTHRDVDTQNKITVDIEGLQNLLDCGKGTARQIGEASGAIISIGRRKFYVVRKVEAYLNSLTE